MASNGFMSGIPFRDEPLATTVQVISMAGAPLPCTITFMTAAGNVKVRTKPGATFFQPTYDSQGTVAGQIVVTLGATVHEVQFTGVAVTDSFRVQ